MISPRELTAKGGGGGSKNLASYECPAKAGDSVAVTGSPHSLKVRASHETFHKPKWCKEVIIVNLFGKKGFSVPRSPK